MYLATIKCIHFQFFSHNLVVDYLRCKEHAYEHQQEDDWDYQDFDYLKQILQYAANSFVTIMASVSVDIA